MKDQLLVQGCFVNSSCFYPKPDKNETSWNEEGGKHAQNILSVTTRTTTTRTERHRDKQNNNNFFIGEELGMKKASSLLLLSSVVAAAKDVVFSFSSCA